MTKQVRRRPVSESGKKIPSRSNNNRLRSRYRSPAERLRESALDTMHLAITDALKVVDDIDVIASEMFIYLGLAMNSSGHDPKQLGKYMIDQGNALLHPDACEDGPHLSQIAYLATAVGLFPELDEMRARVAMATSSTPNGGD